MTGQPPGQEAKRAYLVHMPQAEARHLAGTGPTWPASPQTRLALALREWLAGLSRRRAGLIPIRKVVADLTLILETVPLPQRPARGPFGPGRRGLPLPGQVEYLGGGIVRLDEEAISALAGLADGDDFKVTRTDNGPILSVGADTYPAREEEPDTMRGSLEDDFPWVPLRMVAAGLTCSAHVAAYGRVAIPWRLRCSVCRSG